MRNINTLAHSLLKPHLHKETIAIDATAGNGNDTLFLASHCRFVYAFDIQKESEINTKKRLDAFNNYKFILDSHSHLISYVKDSVDVVMFNLGYLPKSDSTIITKPQTTISALSQALHLLKPKGYLSLCIYIGHDGGKQEQEAIEDWLLKQTNIEITSYQNDHPLAPILKLIKKCK